MVRQIFRLGKKGHIENPPELTAQNAASVSYRYSPEGQEEYRRLFADFTAHLNQTWGKENVLTNGFSPETAPAVIAERIGFDSQAGLDGWFDRCATAAPLVGSSPEEQYRYLECYEYQSCEHKAWEDSEARKWIVWTKDRIASQMAKILLAGRDEYVWSIRD